MAAPRTSPFVAVLALALALAVLVLPCSATERTPGDHSHDHGNREGRGARFMEWLTREVPTIALKSLECIKKNQRELSTALMSLFSDLGKCFDDAKGSATLTVECLFKNSMARVISVVTTGRKVVGCLGYGKGARLCVRVSDIHDDQCPFLVGI